MKYTEEQVRKFLEKNNDEWMNLVEKKIQTKLNSEGIFPPKPKVMGIQNAKLI